ncbi:MAG: thioredoxin family protein [Candidatus Hydrothermarchaeota archaeon]
MIKIEVFTTPSCRYCPYALDVVMRASREFDNVIVEEIDVSTKEGKKRARDLNVLNTPTIAINGTIYFSGVPSKKAVVKAISDISGN